MFIENNRKKSGSNIVWSCGREAGVSRKVGTHGAIRSFKLDTDQILVEWIQYLDITSLVILSRETLRDRFCGTISVEGLETNPEELSRRDSRL